MTTCKDCLQVRALLEKLVKALDDTPAGTLGRPATSAYYAASEFLFPEEYEFRDRFMAQKTTSE